MVTSISEMTSHTRALRVDMSVRCVNSAEHMQRCIQAADWLQKQTPDRGHSVCCPPAPLHSACLAFFAGKISSAQLRNPPQCPSMRHSGARTQACHFFTRSGSAYLIVQARHALRHLCQNNINGRHTLQ